jgi:hypothetical protein
MGECRAGRLPRCQGKAKGGTFRKGAKCGGKRKEEGRNIVLRVMIIIKMKILLHTESREAKTT